MYSGIQPWARTVCVGTTLSGALVAGAMPFDRAQAATIACVHDVGAGGNWNRAELWTGCLGRPPNNRARNRYDVTKTSSVRLGVSSDVVIDHLDMRAGSIRGAGNLTVLDGMLWRGGSLGGQGGSVLSNGTTRIEGDVRKRLGRSAGSHAGGLVINGDAVWTGQRIDNHPLGSLAIGLPGSLDVRTDANFVNGVLINDGLLSKSTSDGGRTRITGELLNRGQLRVTAGELTIEGGGSSAGSMHGAGGAVLGFAGIDLAPAFELLAGSRVTGNVRLRRAAQPLIARAGTHYDTDTTHLTGGELRIDGESSVAGASDLVLDSGRVTGAGTLAVTSSLRWRSGTLASGGITTLDGRGDIDGNATKHIGNADTGAAGEVRNHGQLDWRGTGRINLHADSRFVNAPGASVDIHGDAVFAGGHVVNRGRVVKRSGGGGETRFTGVFDNRGEVVVQQGRLRLSESLAQSGSVHVDAGAVLDADGIDNTGSISGAGRIRIRSKDARLYNAGLLSPGPVTGRLVVNGDYEQGADGILRVDLVASDDYDVLRVNGDVKLDGTLDIRLYDGFVPKLDDRFVFLTASGGVDGSFDSVVLPASDVLRYLLRVDADGARIEVAAVPLPASVWLLACALLSLAARRKVRACDLPSRRAP